MFAIDTIVLEGWRVASGQSITDPVFNEFGGTIRMQMPEFKKHGLDLNSYFGGAEDVAFVCGTLGLDVAPLTVKIVNPEFHLTGVRWTDKFDQPGQPPFYENFFLSPAQVTYRTRTYKALLYIADPATKPGHHQPPTRIEVIAEKIAGIGYGSQARLHYNPSAIALIPKVVEESRSTT